MAVRASKGAGTTMFCVSGRACRSATAVPSERSIIEEDDGVIRTEPATAVAERHALPERIGTVRRELACYLDRLTDASPRLCWRH